MWPFLFLFSSVAQTPIDLAQLQPRSHVALTRERSIFVFLIAGVFLNLFSNIIIKIEDKNKILNHLIRWFNKKDLKINKKLV